MISKKALLAILLAVCVSLIAVVYFQSSEQDNLLVDSVGQNDLKEEKIPDEDIAVMDSICINGKGNCDKKDIPEETPFNNSLCLIIDHMEPKELTHHQLEYYNRYKNSSDFKEVRLYNGEILEWDKAEPYHYNSNAPTKTRFMIQLAKTLDINTEAFLRCHNVTVLSSASPMGSYFVNLNPAEIDNLTKSAFIKKIVEIMPESKIVPDLENISQNEE